jgi:hypothetical protein
MIQTYPKFRKIHMFLKFRMIQMILLIPKIPKNQQHQIARMILKILLIPKIRKNQQHQIVRMILKIRKTQQHLCYQRYLRTLMIRYPPKLPLGWLSMRSMYRIRILQKHLKLMNPY